MYHVFHRTWWKKNPAWPNGLEPHPGQKHTLDEVQTEAEARTLCKEYNSENEPGEYSDKAEYEEI
jgi:hypothetical protein